MPEGEDVPPFFGGKLSLGLGLVGDRGGGKGFSPF